MRSGKPGGSGGGRADKTQSLIDEIEAFGQLIRASENNILDWEGQINANKQNILDWEGQINASKQNILDWEGQISARKQKILDWNQEIIALQEVLQELLD